MSSHKEHSLSSDGELVYGGPSAVVLCLQLQGGEDRAYGKLGLYFCKKIWQHTLQVMDCSEQEIKPSGKVSATILSENVFA